MVHRFCAVAIMFIFMGVRGETPCAKESCTVGSSPPLVSMVQVESLPTPLPTASLCSFFEWTCVVNRGEPIKQIGDMEDALDDCCQAKHYPEVLCETFAAEVFKAFDGNSSEIHDTELCRTLTDIQTLHHDKQSMKLLPRDKELLLSRRQVNASPASFVEATMDSTTSVGKGEQATPTPPPTLWKQHIGYWSEECHWGCYVENYPDLKAAFGDVRNDARDDAAYHHWMDTGATEGRNCGCKIDAQEDSYCVLSRRRRYYDDWDGCKCGRRRRMGRRRGPWC